MTLTDSKFLDASDLQDPTRLSELFLKLTHLNMLVRQFRMHKLKKMEEGWKIKQKKGNGADENWFDSTSKIFKTIKDKDENFYRIQQQLMNPKFVELFGPKKKRQ